MGPLQTARRAALEGVDTMRVLHIPHAYFPVRGGAELVCQRVGEELVGLGHTVRVVTGDVSSVSGYYKLGLPRVGPAREWINGVEVVRVRFGGPPHDAFAALLSRIPPEGLRARLLRINMGLIRRCFSAQLAREIAEYRPDVVVLLPHLVVNVQCALRVRRTRMVFPTVMLPMLHEHDPGWPTDAVKEALRLADATIALTSHEAERLRSAYVEDPSTVFYGGVGVDAPSALPRAERKPSVLYLGRKTARKGVLDLVHAMHQVWTKLPEVTLMIAGARTPDTGEIEAAVAALPPEQQARVSLIDYPSDPDKVRMLRETSCLVQPSRQEALGMVLLEAWACETPVVAYDLPVFRCTVDHGINGFLASTESQGSLATAIDQILADPDRAQNLGRAGYRKALKEFRWSKAAERFLAAYESAAARSRNRLAARRNAGA